MEAVQVRGNTNDDHLSQSVTVNDGERRQSCDVGDSSLQGGDGDKRMTTTDEGMAWLAACGGWNDPGHDGKTGKIRQVVEEGVSDESKRIVANILDQVNMLSTAEKLLLYLQLPSSSGQRIDPLRQPLNPLGSRSEIQQTITWIKTHLQEDQEVSMPKQDIYDEYTSFCALSLMKPLSTADFGKVMKQVFPSVRPRRLGTRGNSRYCYAGMRKRTSLQPPALPNLADRCDNETDGCVDEVSRAANCLVRDWAEKLLGSKFASLHDLAHHLVTNMCVDSRSLASATLIAAMEPQAKRSDGPDSVMPARPESKHRDTQMQLQRKLQEREVIREQKRKLQEQHPRQRSQSADKPRAKKARLKEMVRPKVEVAVSNPSSSETECGDVKPSPTEYVDYSTIARQKPRGLSLDFEPNLSLMSDTTPSPPVKTAFSFSPQTVVKVQIPRLPKVKKELTQPLTPIIHLSPPNRNKYQPIQPKVDPSAVSEEPITPQPKTPTGKSSTSKSPIKTPGKRCRKTTPKLNIKQCVAPEPSVFGIQDKTDVNLPSSFARVIPPERQPSSLSSLNQPVASSSQLRDSLIASSFTSVLPQNETGKKGGRVRNEVSIGSLEKDALDDYLHGGSNSQEQEEELMRYFQQDERPATETKLSQLRQLLERNSDDRPASHSLSILSQRSQQRTNNAATRRRVSFETQEVPPSPNTRRRFFTFTPISPGPHSPLSRSASKPSSANASPFVSPRNTPLPRTRSSYLTMNVRANSPTFTAPPQRGYVSASAPQSPLVSNTTVEAVLAEMARARPIGGQFMGAGDAVEQPPQVPVQQEDVVPDWPPAKSHYRSQSVPLHRMLDATPMPAEYQDFGTNILLDADDASAADVGLNSENLSRIFNLLDDQPDAQPVGEYPADNPQDLGMQGAFPAHDLTLPPTFVENAQDLAMTANFVGNPQVLNLEGNFRENGLALGGTYSENGVGYAPVPYKSSFEYVTTGAYRATLHNSVGPRRNLTALLEAGQFDGGAWSVKPGAGASTLEEQVDRL